MSLSDNCYPIIQKEIEKATEVVVDAFSKDPAMTILKLSDKTLSRMYKLMIKLCLKFGNVYTSSKNFEGIIGILPGNKARTKIWDIIRAKALLSSLSLIPLLGNKTIGRSTKKIDKDIKNLKIGPYIYLGIFGISQDHQGQGYGGKLLRAIIQKADNEEKAIFVETQTKENVKFYEKFGFKVLKKVSNPNWVPMWELVRYKK